MFFGFYYLKEYKAYRYQLDSFKCFNYGYFH